MNNRTKELLSGFQFNTNSDQGSAIGMPSNIGQSIPGDYIEFINAGNGGEGFISDGEYFVAWPIKDICLSKEIDNLVLIGSNGGLENFGIDISTFPCKYIMIPSIGPDKECIRLMGSSFEEFLEKLAKIC